MAKLQRVAVISDTHDRWLPEAVELVRGSDLILHVGDVCAPGVLAAIAGVAPVVAVRGNNDAELDELPMERRVDLNGVRVAMVHIPPRCAPGACDWLLVGHTHRPMDEMRNGVRWLNPGSAGLANKGAPRSLLLLDWSDGAWVVRLHVLRS
jgi:putative phosphoesterase